MSTDKFVRRNNSRFACAVRIEPWMQEMRFQIGEILFTSNQDLMTENWYRRSD